MSHKTAATVAHTIGIDTGKNTLNLIGLDEKGAIVLREKIARQKPQERLQRRPRDRGSRAASTRCHPVNTDD
jgi:transposase